MDDYELVGISSDMPPAAFRWDLLDDDERLATSRELETFVRWLVGRYRLHRHIPPCWWRHGAHVEELSALFIGWRGVMEVPDRPDAWLWWHDHLARMLTRHRELWVTGCTADQHTEPQSGRFERCDSTWRGVTSCHDR